MFNWISDANLLALFGLAGGVMLGLAARLGRFCTLGAIEDALYAGCRLRLRMWGLAIGVAICGTHFLVAQGLITMDHTLYLRLNWSPLGAILGGLIFGYGMALSGNCGLGALARLGGGDLRALVIVMIMGISAYVAISGPLAQLRVFVFPETLADPDALASFSTTMGAYLNLPPALLGMGLGLGVIIWMLTNKDLRTNSTALIWSGVAGGAIVLGWGGTGWVAAQGFSAAPIESHTYSAPLGDMIIYLMTASGSTLNFGLGSVTGVLVGACLGSLIKKQFRWEACDDARELKRQMGGAVLMGFGAVLSFGCSIGQGLSGFALLYYGAPLTLAAIFAGAALGLRQLITGFTAVK